MLRVVIYKMIIAALYSILKYIAFDIFINTLFIYEQFTK